MRFYAVWQPTALGRQITKALVLNSVLKGERHLSSSWAERRREPILQVTGQGDIFHTIGLRVHHEFTLRAADYRKLRALQAAS
jgi:hypothetical protein